MNARHVCVGSDSQSVYLEGAMTRAVVPTRWFLPLSWPNCPDIFDIGRYLVYLPNRRAAQGTYP